jgi:hypothetical protein
LHAAIVYLLSLLIAEVCHCMQQGLRGSIERQDSSERDVLEHTMIGEPQRSAAEGTLDILSAAVASVPDEPVCPISTPLPCTDAALGEAAEHCGDLRFVAAVADVVSVLRRPFTHSNCILHGPMPAAEAAVTASTRYLCSHLLRLEICGASAGTHVCKKLLEAIYNVLRHGEPAVIFIPDKVAEHPDVLAILQALVLHDEASGFFTPAAMEHAFGRDPELIAAVCAQLAPELDTAQA